jgi:DNA-binding beta-propeller fold protein YncE
VRSGSLEDATLWCTSGAVAAGTGGGPSYTVWTTLYSEQRFGAWLQPFSDDPIGGTQPVNVTAGLPISPLFSSSSRVGVKPDGSIVYFADAGGEEIAAFEYGAAGLTPLGSTQVGSFDTGGLAVAHDGSVYFVNGNAIYSYTPTTTPVLNQTGAKQLVSDGTLAGCAVAGDAVFAVSAGSLFVLDRSLNPLRDPISLATGAASIAVSPDGMRAFVYSFWKASTQWQVNVLAPAALTGGTPG